MSNMRWDRVAPIVDAALDTPPEARQALIDELAVGDLAVRDAAQRWLAGCDHVQGFLDAPVTGSRIGPWRVVRELGRGGMGVVYLVEHTDAEMPMRAALKRQRDTVALDGHGVRRFREERRILARLEHPGIARLLDGGVSKDGMPWFAMEYVNGVPVDQWCAAQLLPVPQRLRLIIRICDAVQHAHQRLVVHRDIKPSNVLVDANGTPRLVDFGIAKLVATDSAEGAPLTYTGGAPMSLPFAAPEQLRDEPVSTATDVYGLGVLLHLLLTGALPFGDGRDGRTALELRILAGLSERPSLHVRRRSLTVAGLSSSRLARVLHGDLDVIVERTMHRDAARRYESAAALAGDLQAVLDGRPIHARRDSAVYRARKFIARHPVGMGASALAVVALIGFSAVTRQQALRITLERENAEQVSEFLAQTLAATDSHKRGPVPPTLREVLDRGAQRAETTLVARPEIRGHLLALIAPAYHALGEWQREHELLVQAAALQHASLDADDPRRALVLHQLAQLEMYIGTPEAAVRYAHEAITILERSGSYRGLSVVGVRRLLDVATLRTGQLPPAPVPSRPARP
ncbi:serine/threonine protein kinase [Gemmatimonas sp.]|uniref:serine/threonine protein kinase n=1 Tax=Gemmatimonas sp. TaxID=1962908 RepID=UPI0039839507